MHTKFPAIPTVLLFFILSLTPARGDGPPTVSPQARRAMEEATKRAPAHITAESASASKQKRPFSANDAAKAAERGGQATPPISILNTLVLKRQRTLAIGPVFKNPSFLNRPADWNARTCNNSRWMQGADFEWTSVLNPKETLEAQLVGVSGFVINEHESTQDVWYTHPFGFDWNANVALDPGFEYLFAPGTPSSDDEISKAANGGDATLGFSVANALHVEFDSGLIPQEYRARSGEETVIFGRFIIDCGHTNFTSEIHPPLLLVRSDGGNGISDGVARATVVSRSFLVLQTFDGKPLRDKILSNLATIYSLPVDPIIVGPILAGSYQMTAHPDIARIPFSGIKFMSFSIRPEFGRLKPQDKLLTRYHFSVRPGVAVQVVNGGNDSVVVYVVMNDVAYEPPGLPSPKNVHHTASEIKTAQPDIGSVIDGIRAGGAFSLNPYGDAILEKGFDTDSYQLPTVVEPPLGQFFPVESIAQGAGVELTRNQVYPILGTLEVRWERH
jgi:hypothetical protein